MKAILFVPVLVITIASAAFSQSEDGASGKPKQELDQPKRKGLTLSPDGELAAELTVLFGNEGPGSLIKIWSVTPRKLVQEYRVPGRANVCEFSPDGSTLVTADITGNLARGSTIRVWDLSTGTGRELGTCIGGISKFVFTGDGSRLAALVEVGLLEAFPLQEETGIACVSQIKVWQLADEGEVLDINITDPRGPKVALWPPVQGAEAQQELEALVRKVLPTELSFSSDGRQLVTKTDAGLRTVYDSQTGKTLSSQTSVAQASDKWDEEAAQNEIDGMRRYARAVWDATAAALKQKPRDEFPAVHAFLQDLDAARKAVDPQKAPHEWRRVGIEALAIRNPKYWAAVYELEPAAPMVMLLHASLHAANGDVAPTLYAQLLAVRSPNDKPKEMSRLIDSSVRLIAMGDMAVRVGVTFHDREEYSRAEDAFRNVLSVVPSHSLALYELGNTLRKKDPSKGGRTAAQEQFDKARRVDPFRIEAYQGSFGIDEMRRLAALRSQAKPAWNALMQTSPKEDRVEELERLSAHLQNAGLHELALLVRQLAVAHRETFYSEEDVQFIGASLKALMPEEDFDELLNRLASFKTRVQRLEKK